ncbi:MAG: hypothetical protein ND866_24870 [Pyrinomonadaceae bacterium]|nr:hypothetical protein [Pyrinomonadaceae bacterium]
MRLSDRPRLRNANTQAIALPGNTSALATMASPATASGGAYVGSCVAPGTYGGMRLRLKRNQAADQPRTKVASTVDQCGADTGGASMNEICRRATNDRGRDPEGD